MVSNVSTGESSYDVFLSYNSADHGVVEDVARKLRDEGLKPFLDRCHLAPGMRWRSKLEDTLSSCKAVAIFVGPDEMGSWQQREVDVALDLQSRSSNFPVIPVLLPGCEPLLGFLRQLTWVDLRTQTIDRGIPILGKAVRGESPGADLQRDLDSVRASICPYRGLLHFREEDAPFFFGREAAIDKLANALQCQSFVAVVGASGSGKSSVVRAGLVPRLRSDRSTDWEIVVLVPTDQPLKALAMALIPLLEPTLSEVDHLGEACKLAEHFKSGTVSVDDVVRRILLKQAGTDRVLIVVDQFEELYTLTSDEEARRRFLDELLTASSRAGCKASVALTLRSDFVGKAFAYRPLSDRLQGAQSNLGPMTRQELTLVIRKPAEKLQLNFEAGLVVRILDAVGDEPGNLPLLEFVLTELWEKRRGGLLLNESYDAIGELKGALAKKANDFFAHLSPREQSILQRVFLRLVSHADSGEYTRRRAAFTELPLEAIDLIDKLAKERLLVTNISLTGAAQTVEVAHEALISNWGTLRGWINEDREFLLWRERLDALRMEWERVQQNEDALLREPLLIEAQRWFDQRNQDLSALERIFIITSRELRERLDGEEKKRQEKEFAQARVLVEEQKRLAVAEKERTEEAEKLAAKDERQQAEAGRAAEAEKRRQVDEMRRPAYEYDDTIRPSKDPTPITPLLDENVQFTVYRPREIIPVRWYKMLIFTHLDERPEWLDASEPSPLEEVEDEAQRILGPRLETYRKTTEESRLAVPREGEITLVPEMWGIEFNPPTRSFSWKDVLCLHLETFELRAGPDFNAPTVVRGRVTIFLGHLILAEVALSIRVNKSQGSGTLAHTPSESSSARRFRRIFASYSHKDLEIVKEMERYSLSLGDRYLRDWVDLRTGERWNERLLGMITEADIFQLFWSWNSSQSPHVEREWRHALSLRRETFIRPTYWEDPWPGPPEPLRPIQFQRLEIVRRPERHHLPKFEESMPWAGLRTRARDWQNSGRDPSYLYSGAPLAVAAEWAALHPGELNADEAEFLECSREAHQQRQARELEVAQRLARAEAGRAGEAEKHAQEQKQAASKLRSRAVAATGAAAAALILLALSVVEMHREKIAANHAEQSEIAANDARDHADDLISAMLFRLRLKLKPMGRLDLLNEVGEAANEYLDKIPTDLMTDSCLRMRDITLAIKGDVLRAQGRLPEALVAYQQSLAIAKHLADQDPSNDGWQQDLATSYGRTGEAFSAQGKLSEALAAYQQGLAIAKRLLDKDPSKADWQGILAADYDGVGDVRRAQGKFPEALASYQQGLDIRQKLADQHPSNVDWQRDLSISYDRVGDVRRTQGKFPEALSAYQQGLSIAKRLVDQDPSNVDWQRDLSLSYGRTGEAFSAQGKFPEALAAYQQGLAIAKRLADQYPSNAGWQRDLAIGYDKVADVLVAQGKLPEALAAYQQGLAIAKRLADQYPSNADWQRDLIGVYYRIGICVAQMEGGDNLDQANNFLHRGLDLATLYPGREKQDLINAFNEALKLLNH